jgi:hypothetical protein
MEDTKVSGEDNGYERMVEFNEGEQLTYYKDRTNQSQESEERGKLFINLSVSEILRGISRTFIDIIDELVNGKVHNVSSLLTTFFRGDRMIYVGILFVMIGFAIYIIDITS